MKNKLGIEIQDENSGIYDLKREIIQQKTIIPSLPNKKYRIIYADPPWSYNDSGVIKNDNYGRAKRHYLTMDLKDICNLKVKDIAEKDAILFLWATSPLLEDSFKVINSWGFKYKSSFIWDKVKHNFGHYNSVRHEFLLICTRGSCTPDNLVLYDSVQSIKKTKVHSEKPKIFRNIIDDLYPNGDRIELFARPNLAPWETTNWHFWGAEANV